MPNSVAFVSPLCNWAQHYRNSRPRSSFRHMPRHSVFAVNVFPYAAKSSRNVPFSHALKGLFLSFCKTLFFRHLKKRKIQGIYFEIQGTYFKICALYFLQHALCFFCVRSALRKSPGKISRKPRTQFTVTCFWEEIRKRRDRGKSNLSQRWN